MESRQHCDGGLMVINEATHVNAALQAVLHVPWLTQLLADHSKDCKSLLRCTPCFVSRTYENMKATGVGNPTIFVNRWSFLSEEMTEYEKKDPFQVLCVLIDLLSLQYEKESQDISKVSSRENLELTECPIRQIFETVRIRRAECQMCGVFRLEDRLILVDIPSEVTDGHLDAAVKEYLLTTCDIHCSNCKTKFDCKNISVTMPSQLIVHCHRPCSPTFRLPLSLTLFEKKMNFHSCIAQFHNPDKVIFISLCPDGRVRQFEGIKYTNLSVGTIATTDMFSSSILTLIYSSDSKPQKQVLAQNKTVNKPLSKSSDLSVLCKQKLKITHFPDLTSCDLYNDLPESPKVKSVGTQTDPEKKPTENPTLPSSIQYKIIRVLASYESCKEDPDKFLLFTGLTLEDFETFHTLLGGEDVIRRLKLNYNPSTPERILKSKVSSKNRLFMFLLRLRRGLALEELGYIFGVTDGYAGELCYVMTQHIFKTFKSLEDKLFPSAAEQQKNKPTVMKPFQNLRVILDGASFFIETPSNFEMQGNTYSLYKTHNVMLFLIGVSCHGSTIFCSKGFEGSMSDKEALLRSSGLMNKLQKKDSVMVDRGFDITAELLKIGVHVIKPPSKGDKGYLNAQEEILTKAIAGARIYVEHAIGDIKNNCLLQGDIPLSLYPQIGNLVYIAAFMRNFSTNIVGRETPKKVDEKKSSDKKYDDDEVSD